MRKWNRAQPLIARFRALVAAQTVVGANLAVEQELDDILDEAKSDHRLYSQLGALVFYLRDVVWSVSHAWLGQCDFATMYAAFANRVETWRKRHEEEVLYVTFNWDTLLEYALMNVLGRANPSIADLATHLDAPNYLIKPHGSVDWGYPVLDPGLLRRDDAATADALVQNYDRLEFGDVQKLSHPQVRDGGPRAIFPAMALPVVSKSKFICPPGHLELLTEVLTRVTKVVIVGWRGTEVHFTEQLRSLSKVPALIAGANMGSAIETRETLAAAGVNLDYKPTDLGFSTLVESVEFKKFLST